MATQLPTADVTTDDDAALAGDAGRRLARFVGRGRLALRLPDAGPADEPVVLPPLAVEQLVQLLGTLAAEPPEQVDVGSTGVAVAADVWTPEDFSDWETASA